MGRLHVQRCGLWSNDRPLWRRERSGEKAEGGGHSSAAPIGSSTGHAEARRRVATSRCIGGSHRRRLLRSNVHGAAQEQATARGVLSADCGSGVSGGAVGVGRPKERIFWFYRRGREGLRGKEAEHGSLSGGARRADSGESL